MAVHLLCVPGVTAEGDSSSPPTAAALRPSALRDLLERPADLRAGDQPVDTQALKRFYRSRGFAPAWGVDDGGRKRAALLLAALAAADAHGLDPGSYHLDAIGVRREPPDERDATLRELLLTDAFLRYATHVHSGRVRPEQVDADWGIATGPFDAVASLTRALREPTAFPLVLDSLPPSATEYARLVRTLRRYRAIAARREWPVIPPGLPLRRGDSDARIEALRDRLAAEDDLVSRGPGGPIYDRALEDATRRFQGRHGLAVDGIVGPATLGALNVPATERVRQIGLNLERWRWLPRDLGRRHVIVNAADATLEVVADGRPMLASRVVVGDRRHPTPIVEARLDAVVLNPPWNVPASIAVEEMLPRLRQHPRYLADNGIVILERRDTDPFGLRIDWAGVPSDPLPFRLQQRPGPQNPLGRIKFETPNRFDVYLHDTPTRSLFGRPVRAASHGCVRVERARDVAVYVLASSPTPWSTSMIDEAIASGSTRRVPVAQPLPVYLLYWTVFVDADGVTHFRDDVYGRDRRLAAALEAAHPVAAAGDGTARGCAAADEEARR